ncbi:MAG: ABC transporter permease [Planctomycetota bacterium]|nr:ABC transporter permease [Planctomycetota bacterium]
MPLRLLWRNLLRHPLRSILTVLSVAVAVCLICFLHASVAGLQATVDAAASNRLLVQSKVSLFVNLPLAYQQKMAAVDDVEAICKWQWFGGRFEQAKGGFFAQFGIDSDTFLTSYPELEISEGSYEDFENNRAACIVGEDLAATYGWEVGQTVPISGTIFVRNDGLPWDFTIAGIYRSTTPRIDQQTMYFHYDYLRESLEAGGARGPEGVGVYMLRVAPGGDPVSVQRAVDEMFENGPQRVQTTTEAEFNRQFTTMLGDVPQLLQMVGGAVLFAIFFAVLNTMIMAGRERTKDIGVLKALGFSNSTTALLLVGEALLLCLLGGGLGIVIGLLMETGVQSTVAAVMPGFAFDHNTMWLGAGIAMVVGFVSGLVPALRAAKLNAVSALREVV